MQRDGSDPRLARIRASLAADRNQIARKFADLARDPDAIRKSVEDANALGSAVWLTYTFVVFYLAIAAFGVRHRDLLLENPVKLPFLNIDLPLFIFFLISPMIMLIVHFYVLFYVYVLSSRLSIYILELRNHLADDQVLERLREQLPSSILVQFLGGPAHLHRNILGWLLRSVFWFTLVWAPVVMLLTIQTVFLPYHSAFVTWVHRLALILDVALIWSLWPSIALKGRRPIRGRIRGCATAGLASLFVFGISLTCATFPGEWIDGAVGQIKTIPPNRLTAGLGQPGWTSFHEILFDGPVDDRTLRRKSLFSNTIVLPHFEGTAARHGADDPDGPLGPMQSLRGRDLKGAILTAANLRRFELSFADLTEANLSFADLRNTEMRFTLLRGADLTVARMQGANLTAAHLGGANLQSAYLQGAFLFRAELQGANLDFAKLQAATLSRARLAGAFLEGSDLRLANLDEGQGYGATLIDSDLSGASLRAAELQGARLAGARLKGTSLARALLWRANLDRLRDVGIDGRGLDWSMSRYDDARFQERRWTPKSSPFAPDFYSQIVRANTADQLTIGSNRVVIALRVLDPARAFAMDGKVAEWQSELQSGSIDIQERRTALAETLLKVACSPDGSVGDIVSSVRFSSALKETGDKAPALVKAILADDCPASTTLTPSQQVQLRGMAKLADEALTDTEHGSEPPPRP